MKCSVMFLEGGLLMYAIHYLFIMIVGSIFRVKKETFLSFFFSLILLEIIMFIFLESSLIISLFNKKDSDLFLLFQCIPSLVIVASLRYRKF
jgi:hypothetical protein